MAALVVQSRFAGLKIEDDDHPMDDPQSSKKGKTSTSKKLESTKKNKSTNKTQLVTSKKRKQKPVEATSEQWEQWKQKDEEIVDGNFETQLQEAILLSKLDYEEKKGVYKHLRKEAELEKKLLEQTRSEKKNKKKNVMSLDQFNEMISNGIEPNITISKPEKSSKEETDAPENDTTFFDRIESETKNVIIKDKIIARMLRQTVPDEVITRLHYVEALEKKDKEISTLKQHVTNLKDELLTVKSRNKKLCHILGQGEMKDKAEILMEVERLRGVQSELTAELASLHTDLEKERSKNADSRTKEKRSSTRKKSIRFDVSSEAILSKETSSGTS